MVLFASNEEVKVVILSGGIRLIISILSALAKIAKMPNLINSKLIRSLSLKLT